MRCPKCNNVYMTINYMHTMKCDNLPVAEFINKWGLNKQILRGVLFDWTEIKEIISGSRRAIFLQKHHMDRTVFWKITSGKGQPSHYSFKILFEFALQYKPELKIENIIISSGKLTIQCYRNGYGLNKLSHVLNIGISTIYHMIAEKPILYTTAEKIAKFLNLEVKDVFYNIPDEYHKDGRWVMRKEMI